MIRRGFTKWYVDRGYTFHYGIPHLGTIETCAVWSCPWWVRPLLILFSPSIYYSYKVANEMVDYFIQGLLCGEGRSKEAMDELVDEEKEKEI